jgi:hypothetical protein
MFKGKFAHTGCSPSKHNTRILINSNYCWLILLSIIYSNDDCIFYTV